MISLGSYETNKTNNCVKIISASCISGIFYQFGPGEHVLVKFKGSGTVSSGSHLPSVSSEIEGWELIGVAQAEVEDVDQVGRHMHNYKRRKGR